MTDDEVVETMKPMWYEPITTESVVPEIEISSYEYLISSTSVSLLAAAVNSPASLLRRRSAFSSLLQARLNLLPPSIYLSFHPVVNRRFCLLATKETRYPNPNSKVYPAVLDEIQNQILLDQDQQVEEASADEMESSRQTDQDISGLRREVAEIKAGLDKVNEDKKVARNIGTTLGEFKKSSDKNIKGMKKMVDELKKKIRNRWHLRYRREGDGNCRP
ncbi:hypothetical protein K469DRAFT_694750 [Zopfia rhizophila CBS 207.26]|uniref:Uncharacterized protein n=1 Tax=Zopfia rhizophila CBS 207.26 TaxID=1314779 RepID=A0A6A6EPI6_9PEZI|nr:hypothetical protein K469DRAFT_694750 [Zopfia rhizophila CBS 207.26]